MKVVHKAPLDLNLVAVFDVLIREQSVTRAADELGMSQSAMSHALKRLRNFFDDPLFVKTGEGMKPTPRAASLAGSVLAVMGTIRSDLLVHTRFDAARAKRVFSLCMTDMGELVFLPPLIEALRREAPGCTLRTTQLPPKQIFAALESGNVDLAIGSLQTVPSGLFQQQLFTHPFVTIVNRKNRRIGSRLSEDMFFEMQHIVVSLAEKADEYYDGVVDQYGRPRRIFLTTPHFLTVPLLIAGDANLIATVPRELGRIFSAYKAIRIVDTPIALPRFALRQHWHPRYHHDEANSWLRKLIKDTFEAYPE
jgi:DNA-binding transcriptional LysR family regulator